MNIDTKQLIEMQADQPMPPGFMPLPEHLQANAAQLLTWAEQQQRKRKRQKRKKKKAKRQAAKKARKRNRRR